MTDHRYPLSPTFFLFFADIQISINGAERGSEMYIDTDVSEISIQDDPNAISTGCYSLHNIIVQNAQDDNEWSRDALCTTPSPLH